MVLKLRFVSTVVMLGFPSLVDFQHLVQDNRVPVGDISQLWDKFESPGSQSGWTAESSQTRVHQWRLKSSLNWWRTSRLNLACTRPRNPADKSYSESNELSTFSSQQELDFKLYGI